MKSKRQKILDHFLKGKTLTKIQALNKFGCLNLGDAVFNIRKTHKIKMKMIRTKTSSYARYYMEVIGLSGKFNPENVPHWVKWIAIDGDGDVRGFRRLPFKNKYIDMWNVASHNERSVFLYKEEIPKNWKDEIYTWG